MARRATLRASDQDRERVADRLRHAAAEGRILAEELEDRIGSVFAARTYGQLDALVADLPAPIERRHHALPLWARASFAVALALAALVVLALAAVIIIGLASAWLMWIVLMWAVWGRGRHGHHGPPRRDLRRPPMPPSRRPYLR
jgi:hypothetical protein